MGPNTQPGRDQPIGPLATDGPAAVDCSRPATDPPVISPGPSWAGASSAAAWQALAPAEQEALIGLIAELSLRALRAHRKR